MKVEKVMSKKVISLKADYTLKKAAQIFLKEKISGAPVIDENGKIIGLLSEKDIFRELYPSYDEFMECPGCFRDFEKMEKRVADLEKKKVKRFMSKDVLIADYDDPIMKIGALMLAKGYNRVPVVKDKKLVGLVSRREIYHNIFKEQLGL